MLDRGTWNQIEEGPDFKNARLLLAGKMIKGDIEIHLHSHDWSRHRHNLDSNYNKVILHVCIFTNPTSIQSLSLRKDGQTVPILILLPHLYCAVEEYAENQALAELSGKGSKVASKLDKLGCLSRADMGNHMLKRWESKIGFAQVRLAKQGWTNACHQWFLEVLGYRRNRSPMVRIAQAFPIEYWQRSKTDPQEVYFSQEDWRLRGCRPANHPQKRIMQYANLWRVNPDWMNDLEKMSAQLKIDCFQDTINRKSLLKIVRFWRSSVLGDVFAEGKANTLWIDCVLPLLAHNYQIKAYELWKNWPCGDCPQVYRNFAKTMGWTNRKENKFFTNGFVQCMIGVSSI